MWSNYILDIKLLIEISPDEFFSNKNIVNISPMDYLNMLYKCSNDIIVKYDENSAYGSLAKYMLDDLDKIRDYAEVMRYYAIKNAAFAYISNTTDKFILQLPLEIWKYVFDFI